MSIVLMDKSVRQADFFDDSGAVRNLGRVVRPLVCTCTKELGGTFELYAEFVNPDDTVTGYLACDNYISAPVLGKWDSSGKATRKQQIFFIESAEKTTDESGIVYVKVYAKQMFYKLRAKQMLKSYWDKWCAGFYFPCDDALKQFASTGSWKFDVGATDIYEKKQFPLAGTVSCAGAIMDETGIIRHYGAELHRDNFYISGRKQKEFASGSATSPAFRFFVGKEISGITEAADYTNTITSLKVVLTDGSTRLLYVNPAKIGLIDSVEAYFESSAATDEERLSEAASYFETVNHPQISYIIQMVALKKTQLYKDFAGIAECDIGDVGSVESSALRISTVQKVTRTVEDVLTGEYTEVILGNIPGSIARAVNNTVIVGAESAELDVSDTAGFTADVVSADDSNKLVLYAYTPESASSSYDVYVDTGDLYSGFMSEHQNRMLTHEYAFNGSYKLQYSVIGTYQSNALLGTAAVGIGNTGFVQMDNIIFSDSTSQIGSRVTTTSTGGVSNDEPLITGCVSVTRVTIPDSVRYISPYAFYGCTSLAEITYSGSIAEWTSLSTNSAVPLLGDGWQGVYNITVHCTDGDTIQPGKLGERS